MANTAAWHAEADARHVQVVTALLAQVPDLAAAADATEPTLVLCCPSGHRLVPVTPRRDDTLGVVLVVRQWIDTRIVRRADPGHEGMDPSATLDPLLEFTCPAPRCRYRRTFRHEVLLQHYAVNLGRRTKVALPA